MMTWEQMEKAMEFLTNMQAEMAVKLSRLIDVTNQDATDIRTLAKVAARHERRIRRLENGGKNQQ